MTSWSCVIPGEPIAKGRPRTAVVNGHARLYTPERTARWESHAAWTIRQEWGERAPLSVPVSLHVVAVFTRPKRLMTKRTAGLHAPHVGKPDGDNVLKAAGDACEKAGVLTNDSIAWQASVEKRYTNNGEHPHVRVVLTWG